VPPIPGCRRLVEEQAFEFYARNSTPITSPIGEGIIPGEMGNDWHIPAGDKPADDQHFCEMESGKLMSWLCGLFWVLANQPLLQPGPK